MLPGSVRRAVSGRRCGHRGGDATAGCDAIHPGYGFLAERGDFARSVRDGRTDLRRPRRGASGTVRRQGRARPPRSPADVPVIRGLDHAVTLDEAQSSSRPWAPAGAMIIKAVAGGGGRGTRAVLAADGDRGRPFNAASPRRRRRSAAPMFTSKNSFPAPAISKCRSSAIAPATSRISASASAASSADSKRSSKSPPRRAWMTVCAADHRRGRAVCEKRRLQQSRNIRISGRCLRPARRPAVRVHRGQCSAPGRTHGDRSSDRRRSGARPRSGWRRAQPWPNWAWTGRHRRPRGYAIQARVNMETIGADGSVRPAGGTLTVYEAPNGPGVRTDGFGYAGYRTSRAFDSLLAKVIAHSPSRISPQRSTGRRGRSASSGWRGSAPTFRSSERSWPIPISPPRPSTRAGWMSIWRHS